MCVCVVARVCVKESGYFLISHLSLRSFSFSLFLSFSSLFLRPTENLPGMDVYVTHQMNPDTFAAILRLSGQKKKGKGKKK